MPTTQTTLAVGEMTEAQRYLVLGAWLHSRYRHQDLWAPDDPDLWDSIDMWDQDYWIRKGHILVNRSDRAGNMPQVLASQLGSNDGGWRAMERREQRMWKREAKAFRRTIKYLGLTPCRD